MQMRMHFGAEYHKICGHIIIKMSWEYCSFSNDEKDVICRAFWTIFEEKNGLEKFLFGEKRVSKIQKIGKVLKATYF